MPDVGVCDPEPEPAPLEARLRAAPLRLDERTEAEFEALALLVLGRAVLDESGEGVFEALEEEDGAIAAEGTSRRGNWISQQRRKRVSPVADVEKSETRRKGKQARGGRRQRTATSKRNDGGRDARA